MGYLQRIKRNLGAGGPATLQARSAARRGSGGMARSGADGPGGLARRRGLNSSRRALSSTRALQFRFPAGGLVSSARRWRPRLPGAGAAALRDCGRLAAGFGFGRLGRRGGGLRGAAILLGPGGAGAPPVILRRCGRVSAAAGDSISLGCGISPVGPGLGGGFAYLESAGALQFAFRRGAWSRVRGGGGGGGPRLPGAGAAALRDCGRLAAGLKLRPEFRAARIP